MSGGVYALASCLMLGAGPFDGGYGGSPYPPLLPSHAAPPPSYATSYDGGAVAGDAAAVEGTAYATGGIYGEPLYPYDSQYPWMHGYFQEISPYSGYRAFRPYNYKHVLAQSQAAGGWGMSPKMPYSQQFWHKYQDQAAMRKLPGTVPPEPPPGMPPQAVGYAPQRIHAASGQQYQPTGTAASAPSTVGWQNAAPAAAGYPSEGYRQSTPGYGQPPSGYGSQGGPLMIGPR